MVRGTQTELTNLETRRFTHDAPGSNKSDSDSLESLPLEDNSPSKAGQESEETGFRVGSRSLLLPESLERKDCKPLQDFTANAQPTGNSTRQIPGEQDV